MNIIDLIGSLLDNHDFEWEHDVRTLDQIILFKIKGRPNLIEVKTRTLDVGCFPDYLTWKAREAALQVCLFNSGSEILVERYVRYIRGSTKRNKYQK